MEPRYFIKAYNQQQRTKANIVKRSYQKDNRNLLEQKMDGIFKRNTRKQS